MKSNDKTLEKNEQIMDKLQNGSKEEKVNALTAMFKDLENNIKQQAIDVQNGVLDERVLSSRDVINRPFTSKELKYFNAVIEKNGFDGIDEHMPETITDEIFKYLTEEHPILSRVDRQFVKYRTKLLFTTPNTARAFWGPICEDIRQMILEGFDSLEMETNKLSGFVVICKGLFQLGPQWLGRYVVTVIKEIMATTLEEAVIYGDGVNKPIGIFKSILKHNPDGSFSDKEPVKLLGDKIPFGLKLIGDVSAIMAKSKMVPNVFDVVVNPITYYKLLYPTLMRYSDLSGKWFDNSVAPNINIVQSYAMPENKLVFGDLNNYFLGVAGDVEIKKYEETLAIEDADLFIAKMFANGRPKNENAFVVIDTDNLISDPIGLNVDEFKPAGRYDGEKQLYEGFKSPNNAKEDGGEVNNAQSTPRRNSRRGNNSSAGETPSSPEVTE